MEYYYIPARIKVIRSDNKDIKAKHFGWNVEKSDNI